jgi:nitroimidazol reductase NimA-like FMN-containing flavoprotein (pyridoxamine 5'-phosphate oxidase superfamily)
MYEVNRTTTPSRHAERASFDEQVIHSILDEALIGHLAFIDGGSPHILPMLFVRSGGSMYVHSSTGAHPARMAAREGTLKVSFEVTLVDALVLARSAFSHSANYRCVVTHGELTLVNEPERKDAVLRALMDKLLPGRGDDARSPTRDELRKTAVMELPLVDVGAKVRTGGPLDDDSDLGLDVWAGIQPIVCQRGTAVPADGLRVGIELPAYLAAGAAGAGGAAGAAGAGGAGGAAGAAGAGGAGTRAGGGSLTV